MWTRLKTWMQRRHSSPRETDTTNMDDQADIRVLLVCMGNICRSPMAEGVLRARLSARPGPRRIAIDSAGTHGYHQDAPPDSRAQAAAERRGYSIADLRARRVVIEDFDRFDLILAMDSDNLAVLEDMAPPDSHAQLQLFLDYSPERPGADVPDPYYGGATGFERVLDLIEETIDRLVDELHCMELPSRPVD